MQFAEYIHRPGGFLLFISAALSQNVGICEELLPLRGAPSWGFFFFFFCSTTVQAVATGTDHTN